MGYDCKMNLLERAKKFLEEYESKDIVSNNLLITLLEIDNETISVDESYEKVKSVLEAAGENDSEILSFHLGQLNNLTNHVRTRTS